CPGSDAKGGRPRGEKGSVLGVCGASAGSSVLAAGSSALAAGSPPGGSSSPVVVGDTTVGPGGGANRIVPAGWPHACSAGLVARDRSSRPRRRRASRGSSPSAPGGGDSALG